MQRKQYPKSSFTVCWLITKKPEDLIGENEILKQLTKLLVERALDAEISEQLGH